MSEKNMRDYTQNYIDGTSVVSAGGETIDVINQQRNSPRGRSRVTANAAAFLALDHASYVNGADVHSAHTEDDHEDVRNSRSRVERCLDCRVAVALPRRDWSSILPSA